MPEQYNTALVNQEQLNADYLLIVASSGRMLAQAARKAGLTPLVIDLYADYDTRQAAEAVWQLDSLVLSQFAPVLETVLHRYAVRYCVYGSGFECHPASLYFLQKHITVLGNTADTFTGLQNKALFFAALDRLHIPHPTVRVTAPIDGDDWLIKPVCGQGGVDIRRYLANEAEQSSVLVYWQKYQAGTPHSVLFLTDGRYVQIIGFNTQWTTYLNNRQEFLFSGISNHCSLSVAEKNNFSIWLRQLVCEFDLKGLHSLDFIQTPTNESLILEINPRPPASMQLYGGDLLAKHIASCSALLNPLDKPARQIGYTGFQIVYADQDIQIPNDTVWQAYCYDLPRAKTLIRAGQPICSIIVHRNHPQAVRYALCHYSIQLKKGLYSHASQC